MPSFDVVSEIDEQEVKNAVDQAQREIATRFDFKDTNSTIDLKIPTITVASISEDRLKALVQVIEEKFVKRQISLKTLDYGKIEDATRGTARQVITLKAGLSSDKAKEVNRALKDSGLKVQSQTQGETVRVTGKKRDDLQAAMSFLRDKDFEIPLQYKNMRD
jgi:uncharacterized protein YajQ (UPF0234 family)